VESCPPLADLVQQTMDKNSIIKICDDLLRPLENVIKNGVRSYNIETLDCADLRDFNYVDIRKSEEFRELFDRLNKITGSVVYWFEIISKNTTSEIINALNIYKSNRSSKSVPAIKNKVPENSKILYVGKVKRVFWGRLIQHLGYYKVNQTQGLQLYYWAQNISIKLNVHIVEFEPEMQDLMSVIEYRLANELNPIIGKHK
jgi:hypothetical protein